MGKRAYRLIIASAAISLLFAFSACTASGEPEEIAPTIPDDSGMGKSSSSSGQEDESSSSAESDTTANDSLMYEFFDWTSIPAGTAVLNSVRFDFEDFMMATTEVTQDVYTTVMGTMPQQPMDGAVYPVVNVSWYDAVLFCNALSKLVGVDTAYTYTSVGEKSILGDLSIDYSARAIRLPTEIEWEVAAHGKTSTTYYWGTAKASEYAYYGQSKGPEEVAKFIANDYGLYDMAGNAAEWVNDWFASFPTKDQVNYAGPSQGSLRVMRGGGWSDPIKDCAPDSRDKKDPLYTAPTLGFRVVYSRGL